MSDGTLVDTVAVAHRVLETPEAVYSLTPIEAVALAGFVLQDVTGRVPQLVAPPQAEWRPLPASIAAAVAHYLLLIDQHGIDAMDRSLPIAAAFETLKTRFEKEFPHGSA